MFHNIKSLNFEFNKDSELCITSMTSKEGEIMQFCNDVKVEGRVYDWMNLVLKEMQNSNRYNTKKAIFVYGTAPITR